MRDERLPGTICPACRAELPFAALVCRRCGARLAPLAVVRENLVGGTPIVVYVATPSGPSIAAPARPALRVARHRAYRPDVPRVPLPLPPTSTPTTHPRGEKRRILAVVVPLLVAALGVGTLLLHGTVGHAAPTPGFAAPTPAQGQPGTGDDVCAPAAVTPASAPVGEVHLATALMDERSGDYRPRQLATVVRAGESVYLTFRVATISGGMVRVSLCTRDGRYDGDVPVPPGSQDRYVAFPAAFGPEDRGPGVAVVMWNAEPVAVLRFTIVQ